MAVKREEWPPSKKASKKAQARLWVSAAANQARKGSANSVVKEESAMDNMTEPKPKGHVC